MFDSKKPTVLFLGRFQPFHAGHLAIVQEGIKRVGQVAILVKDCGGTEARSPLAFLEVRLRMLEALDIAGIVDKCSITLVPNISSVYYGRDVGYTIERVELGAELEAVSATRIREQLGL